MNKMNLTEATIKALEGKLLNEDDEIEGQYSFDDMNKGTFIYETSFNLEAPVNNFGAAQEYLDEDDMVQYLDESRCSAAKDIGSIVWILDDEQSGKIRVTAKRELTEEELDQLSDWILGQNSDGLGEGFEQQDFAESYYNPDDGEGPYTRSEAEREIERLWDQIDIDDLISDGYLDDAIWDAVEVYKDEHSSYNEEDEELDDDEIFDIIRDDPYSYLDDEVIDHAKYDYTQNDPQFNIDDWYVMASFDWKTNKYKLKLVS